MSHGERHTFALCASEDSDLIRNVVVHRKKALSKDCQAKTDLTTSYEFLLAHTSKGTFLHVVAQMMNYQMAKTSVKAYELQYLNQSAHNWFQHYINSQLAFCLNLYRTVIDRQVWFPVGPISFQYTLRKHAYSNI